MDTPEPNTRNVILSVATRFAVSVALIVVAFFIASTLVATRPTPVIVSEDLPPRSVVVMEAQSVPVRRAFTGYGVAAAFDRAIVPARVTSTVIEVPPGVRAGARVTAGQVLARLDPIDFEQQLRITRERIEALQAQVELLEIEKTSIQRRAEIRAGEVTLAEREVERVQHAIERQAAKERELDQARQVLFAAQTQEVIARESADRMDLRRTALEADLEREQANERLALEGVSRCAIVTPIDGVLDVVEVKVGESLMAGAPVARVIDPRLIEVSLELPARARPFVSVGDDVSLGGTGDDTVGWTAPVTRISPVDDPSSRTFTVYIDFEQALDARPYLAPGMFVRGRVRGSSDENRWIIPRRSVRSDRILLVRDGVITSRPVETAWQLHGEQPAFGLVDRDWLVLSEALDPGELVVVDPSRFFHEGMPVTPVAPDSSASPAEGAAPTGGVAAE